MNTYTFRISLDGIQKAVFNNCTNDFQVCKYLLNAQGNSMSHAIKYEGWKVEEINEQTFETSFWKLN
jgi:hypothetical protein